MQELLNQIAVLKTLLAEKEAELASISQTEEEKDVEAFKRTHPDVECRTGHITASTFDDGERFRFIIVDRDYPTITSISKTSQHVWIHIHGADYPHNYEDVLLGYGETEAEAWQDAACC